MLRPVQHSTLTVTEKRWVAGINFLPQVKNKTTKRPTPAFCRTSRSHRYDGTRPESTGLSAGTEPRRVQPVRQTTNRPTPPFRSTSR